MTFLAPWALMLGLAGAAGTVLLHLVSRQRPAAYLLPTARFIPDRETLVSRAATRPTDLLLLALRVLLLLAAGAAFARPVLTGQRAARGRIVLLDRSAAVADTTDAWRRARVLADDGTPAVLIAFDSVAVTCEPCRAERQRSSCSGPCEETGPSLRSGRRDAGIGSISAALIAARRAAGAVAARADSVELVLVSPVAAEELDDATSAARALWPGAVRVERVALRADSLATPILEPRDSAFALAGGTVVSWDSSAAPLAAEGLARGGDVVVAMLGRRPMPDAGLVAARWTDGGAAARERTLGAGCVRTVGIALPASGDLPLRPSFQRVVRGLLSRCAGQAPLHAADSAAVARLAGGNALAPAKALRGDTERSSPIVPWLLGFALLCAFGEMAIRDRAAKEVMA